MLGKTNLQHIRESGRLPNVMGSSAHTIMDVAQVIVSYDDGSLKFEVLDEDCSVCMTGQFGLEISNKMSFVVHDGHGRLLFRKEFKDLPASNLVPRKVD